MKTQHATNAVPSCGIGRVVLAVGLGFVAVSAVSFGPMWLVVPVVVAYAATVL